MSDGPAVVQRYAATFDLAGPFEAPGHVTQMQWGPGGRLYVSTALNGSWSYEYNPSTGALSQEIKCSEFNGAGLAFDGNVLYQTTFPGNLWRLSDDDGDFKYGEAGETKVAIVTGMPVGDHGINQIQIRRGALYIGIGARTSNGCTGDYTRASGDDYGGTGFRDGGLGRSWGESAYGGSIGWIQNLAAVPSQTGAANAYPDPTVTQTLIQQDASPYQTLPNKLVVHSAGTRNPYGLVFEEPSGKLFFTNNFHRVNSQGDGSVGFGALRDALDADFSNDVHDQVFEARRGADYGYTNQNWRGVSPYLDPTHRNYVRVHPLRYDALYDAGPYTLHDPANPKGLGPHSSANGIAVIGSRLLPAELDGGLFIARWTDEVEEEEEEGSEKRTLRYADVVCVSRTTKETVRIASGFENPLALLWDRARGLLVSDYGSKKIYVLQIKDRRTRH